MLYFKIDHNNPKTELCKSLMSVKLFLNCLLCPMGQ